MHGFEITTTRIDTNSVRVALAGEADLSAAPAFTPGVDLGH